ncbi:MAG TPA: hypothetical protein VGM14_16720 [Streptosporangiaceae bacterium]
MAGADFQRIRDDLRRAYDGAAYAMNCLLHVPNAELPAVLSSVAGVLWPGGLFFLGVYGGGIEPEEGAAEWDDHIPARFFLANRRSDHPIRDRVIRLHRPPRRASRHRLPDSRHSRSIRRDDVTRFAYARTSKATIMPGS